MKPLRSGSHVHGNRTCRHDGERDDDPPEREASGGVVTELDFRRLVDEHYDRIFRAARFMTNSTQVAEDLVQDTFLAAAESLKNFQGRSSPYTWLYGILYNKFRRHIRRRRFRPVSLHADRDPDHGGMRGDLPPADEPEPGANAERHEAARRVRDAIDELSPDHRTIITMRYVDGLTYQDIARLLGCPLGTVKSRIHYALGKIEGKLGDLGRESG